MNSAKETVGTFDVYTPENFGADKRTRLTMFAIGVTGTAVNFDPSNDLIIDGLVRPNLAESVTVEAQRSDGSTVNLIVEFAGVQGATTWLDQINLVLVPELQGAGRVDLTLLIGGQRSNSLPIFVR